MPIYKDNCMACHGDQLQGGFGPNLTKVGSKRTKQAIVDQINKGSGKMPGFGSVLKPDQVEALAAWLAEKK
jgi:mono/diheme cytochrome c family protein